MIRLSLRQGIGFDLEYNDEICYIAVQEDGHEFFIGFMGAIIKLPFITIEIGDIFEVEVNQK